MVSINFEKAFGDTIRSIENKGFELSPDMAKGVTECLAAARQVYLSGQLEGISTCAEYCYRLVKAMRTLVATDVDSKVQNSNRIVERVLCYHCQTQARDRSTQERADRVMQQLQERVANEAPIVRRVAVMYVAAYRNLIAIDLFSKEGRPVGRAAMAAKTVAIQVRGQRREGAVRAILGDLRRLTQEIDQPSQ